MISLRGGLQNLGGEESVAMLLTLYVSETPAQFPMLTDPGIAATSLVRPYSITFRRWIPLMYHITHLLIAYRSNICKSA